MTFYFSTTFCSYYYWKRLTLIFQQLSITTAIERVWFFNILLLLLKEFDFDFSTTFYYYNYWKCWTIFSSTTAKIWLTFCYYYNTSNEFLNNVLLRFLLLLLHFDWVFEQRFITLFVITTTLRLSFWTTFYLCYFYC